MKGFGCVLGGKEVNMRTFRFFLVFFVIISGLFFVSCEKEDYIETGACKVEMYDSYMVIYNEYKLYNWGSVRMIMQPGGYKIYIRESLGPQEYMIVYLNDFVNDKHERFVPALRTFDTIDIYMTYRDGNLHYKYENDKSIDVEIGKIK
jgi:hypothetical protein